MKLIKLVMFFGLMSVMLAAGLFVAYNRGLIKTPSVNSGLLSAAISLAKKTTNRGSNSANSSDASSSASATSSAEPANGNPVEKFIGSFKSEDTQQQLSTLTERSQAVGGHVGNVLGQYVQVNEEGEEQAFHDSALEYARYAYCQQIVKEYETKQSQIQTSPSPSPN